jgi:hypothetical protein
VPKGWQGPLHYSGTPGDLFLGPGQNSRLILRSLGGATNATEAANARKSEALAGKNGYTPPDIGPATGPGGDATGTKAADMVYDWTSNRGRKHVLDRTVVVNGRAYSLTVLLPYDSWRLDLDRLDPVFRFFTPTS